jgi:hypothetical protein
VPAARFFIAIAFSLVLFASPVAAADSIVAPPASDEPVTLGSLRDRPEERPFDNEWAMPGTAGRGAKNLEAPPDLSEALGVDRLDDPVLQWLPEITAASNATGTPRSLIAGVMRLESSGDPTTVSVVAAQGLMQVMPVEMMAQGIPQEKWQDPATNILAGATILAQRSGAGWETAVAYYFGIGCDAYGTCTFEYATVVLGWANYFAAALNDPISYNMNRIPDVPSSKSTPNQRAKVIGTAQPDSTPVATPRPTQPAVPAQPTEVPTTPPTAEPTPIPTEVPTEVVTEVVPTDVPTEVPIEAPTEPPAPADAPSESTG